MSASPLTPGEEAALEAENKELAERAMDPLPPHLMDQSDRVGWQLHDSLMRTIDGMTIEANKLHGPDAIPIVHVGVLMGLERAKASMLHQLTKNGAHMNSIMGMLGRLHEQHWKFFDQKMQEQDTPRIILPGQVPT